MRTAVKDPDAIARVTEDWGDRLRADATTIASVAWLHTPAGLTLSGPLQAGTSASTLVAGGVLGVTYQVTCRATLADGQVLDRTQALLIQPT